MEIKQEQDGCNGIFYTGDERNKTSQMTYTMDDKDVMVIEHTEVSPELRGKKFGRELVEAAVMYARSNNLKIDPQCRFAKAIFEKEKDYADVLVQQ